MLSYEHFQKLITLKKVHTETETYGLQMNLLLRI